MGKRDQRVDTYIAKAPPFAKPILTTLRAVVHEACPGAVETIKWRMPFFEYEGALCHMAAFKQHCVFGFWKGKLLLGVSSRNAEAMGDFGRITALADLPATARIQRLVKQAMKLNERDVKRVPRRPAPKKEPPVPRDLAAALVKHKKAGITFLAFPPAQRREYIEWLEEAKTATTRQRRLDQAIEWMAEGKSRNWKYMKH